MNLAADLTHAATDTRLDLVAAPLIKREKMRQPGRLGQRVSRGFFRHAQPLCIFRYRGTLVAFNLLVPGLDCLAQLRQLPSLGSRRHVHHGRLVTTARLHARVGGIVEVGKHLVIFTLGNRVILVVMALGTLHGKAHPDIGSGLYPVDNVFDPQFLRKGATPHPRWHGYG